MTEFDSLPSVSTSNTKILFPLNSGMNDRTPFTYLLYCKATKQYYYGSRYSKGCHPSQLWNTYYTSSKVIKQLISEHGTTAFEAKVTRVFDTKEEARQWEYRFLCKVKASKNPNWLNQHNGDGKFINGGGLKLTKEHRDKIAAAHRGKPKPGTSKSMMGNTLRKGTKFNEEQRARVSVARIGNHNRLGVKHSEDVKQIISERTSAALKGKPKTKIECPHCGKIGGAGNMKRYHFEFCKTVL
jgi:hypothetical protein